MARWRNRHDAQRRTLAFALGILIIALAVVGAATLLHLSVQKLTKLTDDTSLIEEYESFLTPVVMNDPDTFDDVTKADMQQLLDIAIWSLLGNKLQPGQYEEYQEGERAGLLVPQEDVEKSFIRLFGTDIKPQHDTVSGEGYDFVYEAARKSYILPITGVWPTYTPDVYAKESGNNSIILTVGYIPAREFAQEENGTVVLPEPDKFMKITLREKEDGSYYIIALQATQAPETLPAKQKTTAAKSTTTGKPVSTSQAVTGTESSATATSEPEEADSE